MGRGSSPEDSPARPFQPNSTSSRVLHDTTHLLRAASPPFFWAAGRSRQCRSRRGSVGRAKPRSRPFPCSVPQPRPASAGSRPSGGYFKGTNRLSAGRGGTRVPRRSARSASGGGLPAFRVGFSPLRLGQHEEEVVFLLRKKHKEEPRAVGRARTNAGGRGSRPHAAPRVVQGEHAGLHAGLHVVKARVTPPRLWWCLSTKKNKKALCQGDKGSLGSGLDPEADRRWTVGR